MKHFFGLLLVILAAGCSSAGQGKLQGSATQVPLFHPARLQNFQTMKIGWIGSNKRQTNEWTWKTTSPASDVKAFYKKELPGAKVVEAGDETVYTWTGFPEAGQDEEVRVVVQGDGVFRVSECLAPKKTRHRDEIVKGFPQDNDLPGGFK